MMSRTIHPFWVASISLLGGMAILTPGCERTPGDDVGEELLVEDHVPRATDRILLAQSVVGAGEDRTLYGHHFDADELNSLGKNKLRMMLEDGGFLADPQVFIASGETAQMSAVRRYLADWGLAFEDTRLHAGSNPATRRPAAIGLAQQQKFEETEIEPVETLSGGSGGG